MIKLINRRNIKSTKQQQKNNNKTTSKHVKKKKKKQQDRKWIDLTSARIFL